MEKKNHILVISQYFYPEQFRINDICHEWVKRGYEVTVLTGIPNYPIGKFYKGYNWFKKRSEIINGIKIIRIPILPRGNISIMLALNYFSFVVSGFFWSIFTRVKADKVFIYEVSPMTQALPGVWYSKRKKIKCFIYVMDLWPDNVEVLTGIKNEKIIGSIGKLVDYIYNSCDCIFTSSKSFVESIKERGVSVSKLKYWPQYAEDFYKPIDRNSLEEELIPLDGALNLTFAGNIGTAQGLDVLPKAALELKKQNIFVRFNIIGDGRYKPLLVEEVNNLKLNDYFNFIDKKPAIDIPKYLAQSDFALITLSKNEIFAKTIPAKLQSILACQKPVIVSADGEVQEIVVNYNIGFCSDAGDHLKLAENIIKATGLTFEGLENLCQNSKICYENNFSKEKLLLEIDKWLS